MPTDYRIANDHRRRLRRLAFKRQGGLCYWCKTPMVNTSPRERPHSVTLEHLVPKYKGGKDTEDNCVAACLQCNNERGGAFTPPFSVQYAPK